MQRQTAIFVLLSPTVLGHKVIQLVLVIVITINQPPFYSHYTDQPALAGTSSYSVEDFVGAKF